MSEANKQLARRWFEEVWNQKSEAAIDAMYHPQGRAYGLPDGGSVLVGPEEFKKFHRAQVGAFPDLHFELKDVIAEGDRVAIRWCGKSATLEGSSFLVIRDGKIFEGWNQMEMQGLLQYLRGGA